MALAAHAVVLADSAQGALESLESSPDPRSRSVATRARALSPFLLADCLHGEVVKRRLIPRALTEKHGLENLVEDLPSFWRMLYTIVKRQAVRTIVVVEIVDHASDDRWFPGRGR